MIMWRSKLALETKTAIVDFSDSLASDESIDGTPVAVERGSSDLTIASITACSVEPIPIPSWGTTWMTPSTLNRSVSLLVSGGVAGEEYEVRVTALTSKGQQLTKILTFRVN